MKKFEIIPTTIDNISDGLVRLRSDWKTSGRIEVKGKTPEDDVRITDHYARISGWDQEAIDYCLEKGIFSKAFKQ